MDAMGSGRPIVATAIPECRLHAERFHVVENGDEFPPRSDEILGQRSDDGRAGLRHAYRAGQYLPRDGRANPRPDLVARGSDRACSDPDLPPGLATQSPGPRPIFRQADGNARRQALKSFAARAAGLPVPRRPGRFIRETLDPRAPR